MNKKIGVYTRKKFHKKRWRQFAFMMACIVVFCTTYALLLPAVTLEKKAACGLEEHQHEESCYEDRLVCGQEESGEHRHSDICYRKVLACGKEVHVHSADCFQDKFLEGAMDGDFLADYTGEDAGTSLLEAAADAGEETGTSLLEEKEDAGDTAVNEQAADSALDLEAEEAEETAGEAQTLSEEIAVGEVGSDEEHSAGEAEAAENQFSEEEGFEAGENLTEETEETVSGETGSVEENPAGQTGSVKENSSEESETAQEQSSAEEAAAEAETPSEETLGETIGENAGATTEQTTPDEMAVNEAAPVQGVAADLACQGQDYEVTVTAGEEAGIPEGASLSVSEIMPETSADNTDTDNNTDTELTYEEYASRTEEALGLEKASDFNIRLFDIKIVDAYGEKIKIQAPVDVKIQLTDQEGSNVSNAQVVHFADETNETDIAEGTNGTEKTDTEALSEPAEKTSTTPSRNAAAGKAKKIKKAAKAKKEKKGDVIQDVTVEAGMLPEDGTSLSFVTEGFSVFAVVRTTIEKTVLASDGHNYRITATYGAETGIPDEADLSVEEITEDSSVYNEYASKTEKALGREEGSAGYIRLFDIKIVDEKGEKIQPKEGSTVDVKIELADAQSAGLNVVHFSDGAENGDVVEASIRDADDGKTVSFVADGFSIYAITDEPGENARIGYRFWYNDGTQNVLLSTQYFRYKDVHPSEGTALTINEPSIPNIDSTTWNRIFRGWSKTTFNDNDSNLITVETLNTELNGLAENDYTEGTFVDLFANLKDVYYVTYVDVNPNNILATEIVPKAESGNTTFNIKPESELRPTIDSDTVLQGWYDINIPDTVYLPNQGNVVVDKNITLYPKIEGGYWLIFDDNDLVDDGNGNMVSGGASFTPPAFYLDEATQEPDKPVWAGYEFGGWYTDRECTTPFTFGENLSHDTTVYAKWIPSASQYRVIYWKQRTTDTYDAAESDKTYDYAGSRLVDTGVVTGQVVTLSNSDTRVYGAGGSSGESDQEYFTYNAAKTDQSITVKADGSSVLNVYYDRQVITINFTVTIAKKLS